MSEEKRLAARYRLHADQLRTIAKSDEHLPTRSALIRVAKDYEKMADNMDALERARQGLF
jgi:hypothetical protein